MILAHSDVNRQSPPPSVEIAPLIDESIRNPNLHSVKLCFLLEGFTFVPFLKRFEYVYEAASNRQGPSSINGSRLIVQPDSTVHRVVILRFPVVK
jgi:hypothetical protein